MKFPITVICLLAAACSYGGQPQPVGAAPADPPALPDAKKPKKEEARKVDPRAYALYAQGISQGNAGDWELAAETFRKVIEIDASATDARVQLGTALFQQGKIDESLDMLKKATETDATSVRARQVYGQMLIRKLRPQEGMAQWEAALAHAEGEEKQELLSALSDACERSGDIGKAIEYANRQLEVDQYSARALARVVDLHLKKGDAAAAMVPLRRLLELHPKDLRLLLQLAQLQTRQRQYDEAAKTYEKCMELVTLDRNRLGLYFSMIDLVDKSNQPERAAEYRRRAAGIIAAAIGEAATGDEERRLAFIVHGKQELDNAIDLFRKAIEAGKPEDAAGLRYDLAVLLMLDKKDTQAMDEVRKAIQQRGDVAAYHGLLGALLTRTENFEEAEKELARAIELAAKDGDAPYRVALARALVGAKKRPQAIEELRKAVQAKPDDMEAKLHLAALLEEDRQSAEAAKLLEAVVPMLGNDEELLLRSRNTLAELYRKLDRLDDAAKQLREAIQIDPAEPYGYVRLAWLLSDQQKHAEAIALLEEAAKKVPAESRTRCLLVQSRIQERAGDKAKAEQMLRKLIETQPSSGVHDALAALLARQGKYEDAVSAAKQAITLADSKELIRHRLHLASIYQDMGQDDECEKLLKQQHEQTPNDPMVNNHLGYFYAEKGKNLDEAVKLIQRALDKEPDNGAYLDSLGWAYFKQGKKDQALKQLELAAQEEPDPVVVDHLGDALLAAGRAADACAKWRKVLELDPDPKLAESIKKKLQEHGGAEGRKPQNTE